MRFRTGLRAVLHAHNISEIPKWVISFEEGLLFKRCQSVYK